MSTKALMTVQQFAQLETGETEDYELVDGERIPLASGTPKHNMVRDLLFLFLGNHLRAHPVGKAIVELDCQLNSDMIRRPDISVFFGKRLQQIDPNRVPAPFAPDIAVEVLSPSESAIDVRRKVRDYLRAGTQEVWLVDAANGEVLVHTNAGIRVLQAADPVSSPLLPGFGVTVAELLA